MNKPKNQFVTLSDSDRKYILDLCSKNSYDHVVDLLARPRAEGGLGLLTSAPALCRYYTAARQDAEHAVLAQQAAAINIRHEQNSNAFLGAIRATVEARVLESLRKGKALADMDREFRFLKIAENLYLADASWRGANPKAARANYQRLVDTCAIAPESDFIPVEELNNDPLHQESITAPSEFELDIIRSRERQACEEEERRRLIASLEASRLRQHELSQKVRLAAQSLNPPAAPSKTPVIPHIPHNSTNSPAHEKIPAQPPAGPAKKPVPYISPTPKAGRNDPCPCGSGRKYKKCCFR